MKYLVFITLLPVLFFMILCKPVNRVSFVQGENNIDVFIDNQLITTYLFSPELTKPILYPILSPSGIRMNRAYPLNIIDGESHDHPHHTGLFFTYDAVNNTGFWNNNTSPPQIKHIEVTAINSGKEQGTLSTRLYWNDEKDRTLLEENRTMIFRPGKNEYTIDFVITLTAIDTLIVFKDTKEGMFAVRVAHWLKEEGGTGCYINSLGDSSESKIWGKRAKWVQLEGQYEGKKVGLTILNHPQSTNFPTYWHVRGYGLFSANPLGQSDFQKRKKIEDPQELNLTLRQGESALFKFRLLVYEGERVKEQIDEVFKQYESI